jgi:putative intracellular protease/amidase
VRKTLLAAAVASSCVVTSISVVVIAGGHGWTAAITAASMILTAPAAALAWVNRQEARGRKMAAMATVVNVICDLALVLFTALEGFEYAADTITHLAPLMMVWGAIWSGWQALALRVLIHARAAPAPPV